MWLTSLSPWEGMTSCKPGKGKQENSLAHLFPKACLFSLLGFGFIENVSKTEWSLSRVMKADSANAEHSPKKRKMRLSICKKLSRRRIIQDISRLEYFFTAK